MAFWIATLKSMLAFSGISGGYSVPRSQAGSLNGINPDYTDPAAKGDMFERGAWWKNRLASQVHPLNDVKRCACGHCSECVSRSYEDQLSAFRQTVDVAGAGKIVESGEDLKASGDQAQGEEEKKKDDEAEKDLRRRPAGTTAELDTADRLLLARLKSIDAAVRRHEEAHLMVAGYLARGGANYDYSRGPDGKDYAVGGDVSIDASTAADPEKTIRKMERVKAAALAPAVPSAQDRRVAASANIRELEASHELEQERLAELEEKRRTGGSSLEGPAQGKPRQG